MVTKGPMAGQQLTGMMVTMRRVNYLTTQLARNQERLTQKMLADSAGTLTRDMLSGPPGTVELKQDGASLLAGA